MDAELRKNVRLNLLGCIFEFSHLEFQRKVWLEAAFENYSSDYTEAICQYFNDLDLSSGLEKFLNEGFVTLKEFNILNKFHTELDNYTERPEKKTLSDKNILLDVEWIEITKMGKGVWEKLKSNIEDENEINFMHNLEKEYLK